MQALIKVVTKLLLTLFVAYVVLIMLMTLLQSNLVYFPSKTMSVTPATIGLEYEKVTFKSSDNTELFGWYIPKKDAKITLLFLHGNGGNISNRLDSIKIFNSLKMNIFIFDYQGYGYSQGSSTEQNTYDDALKAWEHLISKGIKAQNIVIFGRSLGGAIAANLASKVEPKGVILESTFTSIEDMASEAYPFFPSSLISFKYETKKYLKDINVPILVIHSENDNIVPFKFGKEVFEYAKNPKIFLKIRGSHNYGFLESKKLYVESLKSYLDSL